MTKNSESEGMPTTGAEHRSRGLIAVAVFSYLALVGSVLGLLALLSVEPPTSKQLAALTALGGATGGFSREWAFFIWGDREVDPSRISLRLLSAAPQGAIVSTLTYVLLRAALFPSTSSGVNYFGFTGLAIITGYLSSSLVQSLGRLFGVRSEITDSVAQSVTTQLSSALSTQLTEVVDAFLGPKVGNYSGFLLARKSGRALIVKLSPSNSGEGWAWPISITDGEERSEVVFDIVFVPDESSDDIHRGRLLVRPGQDSNEVRVPLAGDDARGSGTLDLLQGGRTIAIFEIDRSNFT